MKTYITAILTLASLMWSCSEEALLPFDGPEPVVNEAILPQGQHDYDANIKALYDRLGVIPMYRFTDEDWCWSVTSDIRMRYDYARDVDHGGYLLVEADERYVGEQLALVQTSVLDVFPDTLLRQLLPMKMLLASDIIHNTGSLTGHLPESDYRHENAYSGYGYVAFSMGSEKVTSLTEAERKTFRIDGLKMLLNRGIDNDIIPCDPDFARVTDYTLSYATTSDANQAGLINEYYLTPKSDWRIMVQNIITTPYSTLASKFLNKYPNIKKKYDIVTTYFIEHYGIDLQAIGNEP